MVGGIYGPIAILAALHERGMTGRGREIDISLHDGLMGMLGYLAQIALVTGEDPQPVGSMHPTIVPYGSFPAADGFVIIAVLSEAFWPKFCQALERPELAMDPRFTTLPKRREHRDALERLISDITRTRSVSEWEQRLAQHDVPYAPILSVSDALSHPQARAREMVVSAEHRDIGEMRMTGRPVKFPGSPQPPLTAPPVLGQDTMDVLRELLGCSDDSLRQLAGKGVIVGPG
jgi:crotonobetainyl-CoA:carnitine CoA-transferase CaiB-like acyl-CoA transferase